MLFLSPRLKQKIDKKHIPPDFHSGDKTSFSPTVHSPLQRNCKHKCVIACTTWFSCQGYVNLSAIFHVPNIPFIYIQPKLSAGISCEKGGEGQERKKCFLRLCPPTI